MKNCPWCKTENESGSAVCRACGITFPGEKSGGIRASLDSGREEHDYRRSLAITCVVVLVLAGMGAGGLYWWRAKSERQEATRRAVEVRKRIADAELGAAQVNATARDFLANGEYVAGLAAVNSVLEIVEMPELLVTKFDLLNNSGRHQEAYLTLVKCLESQTNNAWFHAVAGRMAFDFGKFTAAIEHYEAALRIESHNTDYEIELANILLNTGKTEAGRGILKKLVEDDSHCEDCWVNYGYAFANAGDLTEGITVLSNAVVQFPKNHTYHFHLACLLHNKADAARDSDLLQKAVFHYGRSLRLHPLPNSTAAARILKITGKPVPPELEGMRSDEVKLETAGETRYVHACINGIEGRFVLDTGASYIAVYSNAISGFRLKPTGRKVEMITANGRVQTPVAYAEVKLGQQKLADAMIVFMPDVKADTVQGLFGMEFLGKFGAHIDIARDRLILKRSVDTEDFAAPEKNAGPQHASTDPVTGLVPDTIPVRPTSYTTNQTASRAISPDPPVVTTRPRTLRDASDRVVETTGSGAREKMFDTYNVELAQRVNEVVNKYCQTESGQWYLQTRGAAGEIKFQLRNHPDGSITDVQVIEERFGNQAAERLTTVVYGTSKIPWTDAMKRTASGTVYQELVIPISLGWTNRTAPLR